jgi:iron complex transport system permease protein
VRRLPVFWVALVLSLALLVVAVLSIVTGPMQLPTLASLQTVWHAAIGQDSTALAHHEQTVVLQLRLPRFLLAVLVGALLSQCGVVMQGLFRNPLADPGITGVSTGAALGAVACIALLPPVMAVWLTPIAAFLGGLLATLMVYRFARTPQGTSISMLLLSGVALSAFGGAAIGFLNYSASDRVLRDITLWQMGSLAGASGAHIFLGAITVAVLAFFFQRHAAALNAMALGEAEARYLGIDVEKLKLLLIVLSAIGVGVAVAAAGIIGFVGLVMPHAVRLLSGPDHRSLLPLSALAGALLLAGADLFARTQVAPAELPVGLVTTLLGAPFFLSLLLRQRSKPDGV